METTKKEYIKTHPKSMLAANLVTTDWPNNTKISIIGGLVAPDNKNSNLYAALQDSKTKEYILGGHRQRGTEGWWIAVRIN